MIFVILIIIGAIAFFTFEILLAGKSSNWWRNV